MGTGGPDREKLIATPREEHGLIAHKPAHDASIGNVVNRDALREIGPLRLRLLSSHEILPSSDPLQVLTTRDAGLFALQTFGTKCTLFSLPGVRPRARET